MEVDLWDADRIAIIGSIMSRYSQHLRDGDRVRLQCEGDPCTTFRSASEAPIGTVTNLERQGSHVSFTLELPDGTSRKMNNSSIKADDCWEIDPAYIDTFRGHVLQDKHLDVERDIGVSDVSFDLKRESNSVEATPVASEELNSLRDQLDELSIRYRRAEDEHRAFRETMASAVRHIAGDVFKISNGEAIQFSPTYIDSFDLAQNERASTSVFRKSIDRHDHEPDPVHKYESYDVYDTRHDSRHDHEDDDSGMKQYKGLSPDLEKKSLRSKEKSDFKVHSIAYNDLADRHTDVSQ